MPRSRLPVVLVALALSLASGCTPSRPPAASAVARSTTASDPFTPAIAASRSRVGDLLASGTPAASVAVAVSGRVVWEEAFGEADVAAHRPATTSTRFRIGSVSKPLTAAGAVLLVQEGKLDLDAPVQRYVPSFPEKPWPLTARELGGHLGGVRHYQGGEFESDVPYATVVASLAIFANDPLLFEPGTKYAYSSYGYDLLSAEMETAAGAPFLDFMQARVLGPLALTHTEPDRAGASVVDRATFYVRTEHGPVVAPPVDLSCKWAAGGYLSTPHDLVQFGSALLAPGFLAQSSLDLLFTSMKTRDGQETHYGFGWEMKTDKRGRRWKFHTGAAMGGETVLLVWPEKKLVVAMTANASDEKHDRPRTSYPDAKAIADSFAEAL